MIIASLNINGVGCDSKKDWVRRICDENKVNFLGIQESKTQDDSRRLINSLWGNYSCEYAAKKASGNSRVISWLFGIINFFL